MAWNRATYQVPPYIQGLPWNKITSTYRLPLLHPLHIPVPSYSSIVFCSLAWNSFTSACVADLQPCPCSGTYSVVLNCTRKACPTLSPWCVFESALSASGVLTSSHSNLNDTYPGYQAHFSVLPIEYSTLRIFSKKTRLNTRMEVNCIYHEITRHSLWYYVVQKLRLHVGLLLQRDNRGTIE